MHADPSDKAAAARNCTELWILRQFFCASRGWNRGIGVLLVRVFVTSIKLLALSISAVLERIHDVVL